jgi:hypothetical protein
MPNPHIFNTFTIFSHLFSVSKVSFPEFPSRPEKIIDFSFSGDVIAADEVLFGRFAPLQ